MSEREAFHALLGGVSFPKGLEGGGKITLEVPLKDVPEMIWLAPLVGQPLLVLGIERDPGAV